MLAPRTTHNGEGEGKANPNEWNSYWFFEYMDL